MTKPLNFFSFVLYFCSSCFTKMTRDSFLLTLGLTEEESFFSLNTLVPLELFRLFPFVSWLGSFQILRLLWKLRLRIKSNDLEAVGSRSINNISFIYLLRSIPALLRLLHSFPLTEATSNLLTPHNALAIIMRLVTKSSTKYDLPGNMLLKCIRFVILVL